MKVEINIECDTIAEFHSHLIRLSEQIKSETERLKLAYNYEFPGGGVVDLDDDNCYGSHIVTITPSV